MNKVVKLDGPAAEPSGKKIAKPQAGAPDMRALHKKIAARFPKTIARLAE